MCLFSPWSDSRSWAGSRTSSLAAGLRRWGRGGFRGRGSSRGRSLFRKKINIWNIYFLTHFDKHWKIKRGEICPNYCFVSRAKTWSRQHFAGKKSRGKYRSRTGHFLTETHPIPWCIASWRTRRPRWAGTPPPPMEIWRTRMNRSPPPGRPRGTGCRTGGTEGPGLKKKEKHGINI